MIYEEKIRRIFFIEHGKGGKKTEVNYNVIYITKDNKEIEENKLKDIIAKKLLRVILVEEENSVALNNS